jgi:hypothetical protein
MIAARCEHPAAAIDHTLRRLGRSAGRAPPFPVLRGSRGHTVYRAFDTGMSELQRHAVAECQIARSDEKDIEARNRGDFLDGLHRLTIFNLQSQKYLFISVSDVLASICETPVGIGSGAIQAAPAEGREAHPVHPLPGLSGAAAVRHHDSVRPKFKRPHRRVIAGFKNADHQIRAGETARQRDGTDCVISEGAMLHVEPNAVVPDAPDDFRQPRISHATQAGDVYKTAGAQLLQNSTFCHIELTGHDTVNDNAHCSSPGGGNPEPWTRRRRMRIAEQGVIHRGEPGTNTAVATFPGISVLDDGSLLAVYRAGPSKDSAGSVTMLRRSLDCGRTWSDPWRPFDDAAGGISGSHQVVYVTSLDAGCLIAAACWVNREAFPGAPLFNPETEGCLPMDILVAESRDRGRSWTAWRKIPLPEDIGPASLTNPILQLGSGRLAMSIETNKHYQDTSSWRQRVVYIYSSDDGRSWTEPRIICEDPSGVLFYWDQRSAVSTDGSLATFSWTYHKRENRYLNIRRRISRDEGLTWTEPEDLGFADQPSHPAILADGSAVLAWVDRYATQSIRARRAPKITGGFDAATELVIYQHHRQGEFTSNTGEMLSDMSSWSFGLPFAEALPDGAVLVVFYAGTAEAMDIRWARLEM